MRVLSVITILAALVLPITAFADTQTFIVTHTYILGDDDSRTMARQKCLAEAKRKILEQVGVYLESKSELITSSQSTTTGSARSLQTTNEERQQITEQISTLATGVMRTELIKEEFGEANGRLQLTLTVKSQVDPDNLQKQLAARLVDAGVREDVAVQKERLKRLEAQLEAIQRQQSGQAPGRAPASPPIDISAADLQMVQTQAAQGNAKAQYVLGLIYAKGRGMPQDYVRAYMWLNLAAAHLTNNARMDGATEDRDEVAQRMTPAQIAEAQRLAQQCQAQQLKGC